MASCGADLAIGLPLKVAFWILKFFEDEAFIFLLCFTLANRGPTAVSKFDISQAWYMYDVLSPLQIIDNHCFYHVLPAG